MSMSDYVTYEFNVDVRAVGWKMGRMIDGSDAVPFEKQMTKTMRVTMRDSDRVPDDIRDVLLKHVKDNCLDDMYDRYDKWPLSTNDINWFNVYNIKYGINGGSLIYLIDSVEDTITDLPDLYY